MARVKRTDVPAPVTSDSKDKDTATKKIKHRKGKQCTKKKKPKRKPEPERIRQPTDESKYSGLFKISDADRIKFQNVPRPKRGKQQYNSKWDKELLREGRNRWYFDNRDKQKKKAQHESSNLADISKPPRRSTRGIKTNKLAMKALREINEDYVHHDGGEDGPIKLQFWKGIVPLLWLSGLAKSIRACFNSRDKLPKSVRNQIVLREDTIHMGTWPDSRSYFYLTAEMRATPYCVSFLENENNVGLLNWLSVHFQKHFSSHFDSYSDLNVPDVMRLTGRAFPTLAINRGTADPHYDHKDRIDGISYLVCCGDFEGGELVFRDLG